MRTDAAHDVPGLAQYEADVEKRQRATEQAEQEYGHCEYDWERMYDLLGEDDSVLQAALKAVREATSEEAQAHGQSPHGIAAWGGFLSCLRKAGAGKAIDRILQAEQDKRFEELMDARRGD